MKKKTFAGLVAGVFMLSFVMVANASTTTFLIDPTSTYLRGDAWGPGDGRYDDPGTPLILDLSTYGFNPGDYIKLTQYGARSWRNETEATTVMNGVFSSTNTLLSNSLLNRVPGAIDAGTDYITGPILDGSTSDIVQDFRIDPSLIIQIPNNALYLFIGTTDSFYWDNKDTDNNYKVSISSVPIPATIWLLYSGLIGLIGIKNRP